MSPLERETLALAGGLRSRVETRYGVNSSVGRRIPSGVRRACVVAFAIAGRMPPRGRKGSCAATVPAPVAAVLVTGPFVAAPARGRLPSEVWRSFARVWRQDERASGRGRR